MKRMTSYPETQPKGIFNPNSIPATLALLTQDNVGALAVVGLVESNGQTCSLAVYSPAEDGHQSAFRNALDLELDYVDGELAFDEPAAPYYGTQELTVDLQEAASMLGFDRVVCLLIQRPDGSIRACRDYTDVEVTALEACKTQWLRLLEEAPAPLPPSLRLQ